MKTILFITLALLAVYADEECAMAPTIAACVAEAGLPTDTTEKILKDGFGSLSHDEKCVFKCMLMKVKVLNEDGSYDQDAVNAFMDADKIPAEKRGMVGDCLANKGTDLCETATMVVECYATKLM